MKDNYILAATKAGFHHIAYSEWGVANPAYPPLLCVPGYLRNRHDFDSIAEFLSKKGRHVFCVDIAGRGDSDWFSDPSYYHFDQYIADLTTLIARLNAPQIDWLGTSMGGLVGMMIAALPNNPIRRLILNDVGAQIPVLALWRLARYAGKSPLFTSKEQAIQYFKRIYADFGNLTETQWEYFAQHSIKQNEQGYYTSAVDANIVHAKTKWQFLKELVKTPHKALEGILFDVDLWSTWQQVTCPVCIIHGRRSDILLPSTIAKMQQTHPDTQVLEIIDAGHAPALLTFNEQEQIANWLK